MKTGLLTFETYLGKKDIGSSRIRGKWIVDNWLKAGQDIGTAELYKQGGSYDVLIFQKAYWVQMAKEFKGLKILDLCDPDWLIWTYPVKEMIEEVDAITCSSFEIAKFITGITDKPVVFIPDRIDLSILPAPKVHTGETKSVAWYGYSHNFPMLEASMPAMLKRKLKVYVISNQVFIPSSTVRDVEIINFPWSEHYMTDLQKADVVINPQLKKGKWKYKSDNKTSMSWALGLPVATTDTELDSFVSETSRINEAVKRLKQVQEEYNILTSVVELKDLILELQNDRR